MGNCQQRFRKDGLVDLNMFEELKAWAEKWNVPHQIIEREGWKKITFDSITYYDAILSVNTKTGEFTWYGGD